MTKMKLLIVPALALTVMACGGRNDAAESPGETAVSAPSSPSTASTGNPAEAPVVIDLRFRESADAPFTSLSRLTVPAEHEIHDFMFPYEGIGWENGYVGYRLYLDERAASDIFGKQVTSPALPDIDDFGSYHELAPWGMDVLKVGDSLGIGALGIIREGVPTQIGAMKELSAEIVEQGTSSGRFRVSYVGVDPEGDTEKRIDAEYQLTATSPLTTVAVSASSGLPLATGIVAHEGVEFMQASDEGIWRYIATFGPQSENKDNLGMGVFYRSDQGSHGGMSNATHYVAFNTSEFEYGFLASWAKDPGGIDSEEEFRALLDQTQTTLNNR